MTRTVKFRPMEIKDIDQVFEIEAESFPKPWSKKILREELEINKSASYTVGEIDGVLIGFYGLWIIDGVSHVICLAVSKDYRNMGCGSMLIKNLISKSREVGVETISLEVLLSNSQAIYLYEKYGFEKRAMRMSYYRRNNESCFVMTKEL